LDMLSRALTYLVDAKISSNFFFKACPSLSGLFSTSNSIY